MLKRKQIRWKQWDYSRPGIYFVTICTNEQISYFGQVKNSEMALNETGKMIEKTWVLLDEKFSNILLDEFVVMPNHFHGIIKIYDFNVNQETNEIVGVIQSKQPKQNRRGDLIQQSTNASRTVGAIHELPLQKRKERRQMLLPKIIGYFKMNCSKKFNQLNKTPGQKLWQRNYHDHVIRTEKSLNRIRNYILFNPVQWEYDQENPNAIPNEYETRFWNSLKREGTKNEVEKLSI